MALPNETSRVAYLGLGTIGPYQIPFPFISAGDITVWVNGTKLGVNDYTVVGAGDSEGGTFTTETVYTTQDVITVARLVDLTQLYHYITGGDFPPDLLEQNQDYQLMQIQQIHRITQSCLRIPDFEDGGIDEMPDAETRALHIVGFDEAGDLVMVLLEYLNSAVALENAVLAAAASAAAALVSELAAAVSAAAALVSELNAWNSAISAKGYITIAALDQATIPTGYPVDQMSVMAVSTIAEGGTWDYRGKVTTHVFTNVIGTFDTSYLQIFSPDENNALGSWTKVRHGLTGGTTWSAWGEWTDALSRSGGGIVSGDTEFSGVLQTTGTVDPNDTTAVLPSKFVQQSPWLALRDQFNPFGFTYVATGTSTAAGAYVNGEIHVDIDDLAAGENVSFQVGGTSSIYTSGRDMEWGMRLAGVDSETIFRFSVGDLADPTAEILSTDDGVQFILDNLSGERMKIILSHGGVLYDSDWQAINWWIGANHDLLFKIAADGKVSIFTTGFGQTLVYESPDLHPWTGVGLLQPVYTYLVVERSGIAPSPLDLNLSNFTKAIIPI
jgi:hypothetical protein